MSWAVVCGLSALYSHAHSLVQERRSPMNRPYTGFGSRSESTPQTEPIPGKDMVQNNAGGYAFSVDDMQRLQRFLILGSSSPTYYSSARKLTKENLDVV